MILCSKNLHDCYPCCDFCVHCVHESWTENGKQHYGAPIGCSLHEDADHQILAESCSCCQDYLCFRVDKAAGRWFKVDINDWKP